MLKHLAIFWMVLVIFGSDCRADQIQAKDKHQQPVATVPTQQPNAASLQEKQQQDVNANVKIVNPPEKDFYDKAPVWINFALVIVALGTGIVIGWQAWLLRKTLDEIHGQAVLMKQQGEIQAAGMQQWVDVVPKGVNERQVLYVTDTVDLILYFEAVNNTAYALTITKIFTVLEDWPGVSEVFTVETSMTVPPGKDGNDNSYPFQIPLRLSGDDLKRFREGTIHTINGQITYRDCMKNVCTQDFGGLYKCGPDHFSFIRHLGITPNHRTERTEQDQAN